MRTTTRLLVTAFVVILGVALAPAAHAAQDKQPLFTFAPPNDPVTGAYSKLSRSGTGIATQIRTAAPAGDAVTVWYVIFNMPGACSDACGEDDIFVNGDPNQGFNFEQINAARISVVFGGDGDVVNPGGRLALDGGLAEGAVPTGVNQVVIGHPDDGTLVPGPVTGLEDASSAEVHIVLQDHGTAHEDPDLLAAQLSGFQTACNPVCTDIQFAVHQP